MDFGPNNWYPEPVPTWNLQTPTIFVPPSPTLVNPTLSPPPHGSPHFIPPFQSPSIPAFIPNPAAVQIIDAFAEFRQTMDECFNDFRADIGKVQERLRERGRLIKELRSKVSSVATTPGPRYAPEDPTLPRPWRGLIDGSTGSLYYWNPATHQTQYERPCEQAWITQPEDVSWDDSAKVLISTSDGSCSHSDLSYQTHSNASDATNVEIAISNVVGLHKPEAVDIHGFISEEISPASPNPNSDDNVVAGGTITDVALGSAPLLDHELVSLNASAAMVSNVSHHLSTVISESTLSSTNGSVLGSATTPKKFKTVPVHHHLKTRSNIKMKRQPLSKPARRSRTRIGGDSETTKYGPPSLIMSTKADDLDVHDDPSMELAFYPQTLTGTTMAFEKLQSMRLSFRPEDYYAEMVKSASELENMKCQLSVQMTTNQRPASLSQVFTKWNLVFQAFRGHSVSNLFGLYHHCLNGKVGQEKWPPDEWIEKMKWDVNNLFDWLNSTISEFGTVATLNAWLHDMFMCQPLEYRLENINLFLVIMMKSQSTDVGNSIVQLLGGILEPAMFWVIYTTHGQMHKTKFFSSKQGLLDIDYTYQTTINKPPASMKGWPHETFRNPWRKRTTNVRYFIEFLEIGCYYESAIMLTSPARDIVRLISAKYLVADLSKTLGCMLFIRTLLHMFMDESHASGEPSEFYPATVDIALAMIIVSFAFLFAVLHVCYKFHGCHSTEKDLRSRKNGRDDSIFQKGSGKLLSILVAGDVASRELDLFHVTTYDFPKGIHDSVHTFGRAGMVVKLIKESMKEIPDWLNDDATQLLSYGGEHSQWYGSNDFGNFALIPPTHFPLPLTNDALFLIFFMRLIYLQLITFVISRPMHLTSPGINFGIPKIIKHCVMADFNWRFQEKIIFQNNRSISTGYAREYRARLLRKWGIVYVTACCGCASYLVKSGNVDGKRLYITVGSASPYTSSAILVLRELFRARAPLSGVANFNMFRAETCSLESHYMDNHVDDDNNFFVLSPINLGVQCSCPMILFQGQEDKIVPEFFFLRAFRVADHCPLGIFVLNSINQLVFLKFMNQGLERKYGAVYRGNSCSHVRCSLYFVDFMSTWLIENGFVAIDYGDLALLPHTSFSVPMRSREASMLILFSTLMHSQLIGIGISVYLLPGVNGEALRVFSNVQTQYCWQSIPNSHVSVHPCALIHNCQVTTADGIAIGATLIDITSDAIHGDSRSFTYQVIEGPAEQMPLLLRIWTACASVETKFFHYFQLFLTYVSGVKVSQGAVFVFVCGDQGAHALITYSEVTNGYTISTVDLLYIINRADTVGMHDFSRAGQFGNNRVWVNDTTCFSRQMGNLEAHFLSEKKVIHQSVTSDLKKGTTETGRQQTVSCVTDADLLLRFLLLTLTEEKSKLLILVYYYPCQLTSYCLLFFRFALGKWMHEVDWMINTVQWNGFYCSNLGTVKA